MVIEEKIVEMLRGVELENKLIERLRINAAEKPHEMPGYAEQISKAAEKMKRYSDNLKILSLVVNSKMSEFKLDAELIPAR